MVAISSLLMCVSVRNSENGIEKKEEKNRGN